MAKSTRLTPTGHQSDQHSPVRYHWRSGTVTRLIRLDAGELDHLAHFSVSSAMSLPKSAGDLASGVPPMSATRGLILGSARPALISLLILSMISTGVFLGAPTPCHPLVSYPGTKSPTVGRSGSNSERLALVTASGRSLPAARRLLSKAHNCLQRMET